MKKISITNKELEYGINAENVFWVKNGILAKDHLRQSRDEEMVADLIAYMVSEVPVASRTELFDDYFAASSSMSGVRLERYENMDLAIRRRGPELVCSDYQRVHDSLVLILNRKNITLAELLFPNGAVVNPIPRYFQAVFLAFHDLIVKRNMVVADSNGLINCLADSGKNITIQEGGRWGAENRGSAVNSVVGWIQRFFEEDRNPDPAQVHWVTKLQNLLTNSKIEQSAYDFKQGFLTLSNNPTFDNQSFEKILKTCAAISNISKGHRGYVLVGVAENVETATRVEEIFEASATPCEGFYITGLEHEANYLGKSLDQLFQDIADKIASSNLSEPLRSYVNTHIKCVSYYDKTIVVFEVVGQQQPSLFNGAFYERQGAQVKLIPNENLGSLFSRFS